MWKKSRDSALKRSTALVVVSILSPLALLADPQGALAACSTSGVDPVTVSCAANTSTTNSANTTSPNAATSDSVQSFNADLIGQVNGGVTVDTFGLNLVTTKANGGIAFTNSGAVTSNQNVNTLQLDGNGGAVTYGGAGSITNTGNGAGLRLSNIGAGTITATVAGAVTTSASDGINAFGADGLVTVNSHGAINAGFDGVHATSNGTGGITVAANANVSAADIGIFATSATLRWARTPRPAGSMAPQSAPTIASHRLRWRALRLPAAAPIFRSPMDWEAVAPTCSRPARSFVTASVPPISRRRLLTVGRTSPPTAP